MGWAVAKKQKPQKQDEDCASATQLHIPRSSSILSSPQVVDEVLSSSKAQPGMMRIAKGTTKARGTGQSGGRRSPARTQRG